MPFSFGTKRAMKHPNKQRMQCESLENRSLLTSTGIEPVSEPSRDCDYRETSVETATFSEEANTMDLSRDADSEFADGSIPTETLSLNFDKVDDDDVGSRDISIGDTAESDGASQDSAIVGQTLINVP